MHPSILFVRTKNSGRAERGITFILKEKDRGVETINVRIIIKRALEDILQQVQNERGTKNRRIKVKS